MNKRTILLEGKSLLAGNTETMDAVQSAHYIKVLRMQEGEEVHITDGQGSLYLGKFLNAKNSKQAQLKIEKLLTQEPRPEELHLEIAMSKNNTMDWIIEKATEVGATHITPVFSSRSVVRPDSDLAKYTARWQTISNGALEQSERLWKVKINEPMLWKNWMSSFSDQKLNRYAFFSELRMGLDSTAQGEEALAKAFEQMQNSKTIPLCLVFGPEGGFSEKEQTEMLQAKVKALSLGKAVLRVETAVIVGLTLARVGRCVS